MSQPVRQREPASGPSGLPASPGRWGWGGARHRALPRAEGSRDGAQGAPPRLWGHAPLVLAEDVCWASSSSDHECGVPPSLCRGPWSQRCRLSQARGWDTGRARRVPGSPFVPAPLRVSWSPRSLGGLRDHPVHRVVSFRTWEGSPPHPPPPPVLLAAFQNSALLSQARVGWLVAVATPSLLAAPVHLVCVLGSCSAHDTLPPSCGSRGGSGGLGFPSCDPCSPAVLADPDPSASAPVGARLARVAQLTGVGQMLLPSSCPPWVASIRTSSS